MRSSSLMKKNDMSLSIHCHKFFNKWGPMGSIGRGVALAPY